MWRDECGFKHNRAECPFEAWQLIQAREVIQ